MDKNKISVVVIWVVAVLIITGLVEAALVINDAPPLSIDTNSLYVDLEIRPVTSGTAFRPHGAGGFEGGLQFWVDVYLISASKTKLADTKIKLTSPGINFLPSGSPEGLNGIFLSPVTFSQTTANTAVLFYDAPITAPTIMPKAKMYFGSIKAYRSSPGDLSFTLDPSSTAWYVQNEGAYVLKLRNVKTITTGACIYTPSELCQGKCGIVDNGCGGVVDCTQYDVAVNSCGSGQACINNECVVINQLSSAPSYDQTLAQGITDALSNATGKFSKLSAIILALQAWFADPANTS